MSKKQLLLIGGALAVAVAAVALFPTRTFVVHLVRWLRESGTDGRLIFAAVYLGAVTLMIPSSMLTALAGFLWGPLVGTALVLPPSIVGTLLAWVLTRFVARGWVERRLGRYPKMAAIDSALGEQPITLMTLLRLCPVVPSNVLNYALAVTRVRFRQYVVASIFGIVPGTLMFVYAGSAITNLRHLGDAKRAPGAQVLYWAGLLATLGASILLTRFARRALARHRASACPEAGGAAQR